MFAYTGEGLQKNKKHPLPSKYTLFFLLNVINTMQITQSTVYTDILIIQLTTSKLIS